MIVVGCLLEGIDGNSRCVCFVMIVWLEREESYLIFYF